MFNQLVYGSDLICLCNCWKTVRLKKEKGIFYSRYCVCICVCVYLRNLVLKCVKKHAFIKEKLCERELEYVRISDLKIVWFSPSGINIWTRCSKTSNSYLVRSLRTNFILMNRIIRRYVSLKTIICLHVCCSITYLNKYLRV